MTTSYVTEGTQGFFATATYVSEALADGFRPARPSTIAHIREATANEMRIKRTKKRVHWWHYRKPHKKLSFKPGKVPNVMLL